MHVSVASGVMLERHVSVEDDEPECYVTFDASALTESERTGLRIKFITAAGQAVWTEANWTYGPTFIERVCGTESDFIEVRFGDQGLDRIVRFVPGQRGVEVR